MIGEAAGLCTLGAAAHVLGPWLLQQDALRRYERQRAAGRDGAAMDISKILDSLQARRRWPAPRRPGRRARRPSGVALPGRGSQPPTW